MSLAAVVIASEKRRETTFRECLESVRSQDFDEVIVVADFPCEAKGVRSFMVAPMLRNTLDALVKRDVGYMATTSEAILYLCDDHICDPSFVQHYRATYEPDSDWHVLVPARSAIQAGERVWLNVGKQENYAGGHASIERRICGYLMPWGSTLHHPNWDLFRSHQLVKAGAHLEFAGKNLSIIDIERSDPVAVKKKEKPFAVNPAILTQAAATRAAVADMERANPEMAKKKEKGELIAVGAALLTQAEANRIAVAAGVVDNVPHQPGSTEPWISRLVADFIIAKGAKTVLETASFVGATSVWIYHALARLGGGDYHFCEVDEERYAATRHRFAYFEGDTTLVNVHGHKGNVLDWLKEDNQRYDVAWLDDDHRKEHVMEELDLLLPQMNRGGIILLHDVYGVSDLHTIVTKFGGYSIELPRLGPAGGLGLIQIR